MSRPAQALLFSPFFSYFSGRDKRKEGVYIAFPRNIILTEIIVDADLNVYGISGLKIADLSVPPQHVAANTYNAALLVGEKAADIFVGELGLV